MCRFSSLAFRHPKYFKVAQFSLLFLKKDGIWISLQYFSLNKSSALCKNSQKVEMNWGGRLDYEAKRENFVNKFLTNLANTRWEVSRQKIFVSQSKEFVEEATAIVCGPLYYDFDWFRIQIVIARTENNFCSPRPALARHIRLREIFSTLNTFLLRICLLYRRAREWETGAANQDVNVAKELSRQAELV